MPADYVLYDYLPSGNGYKVRLLLALLGLPFELRERNITQGETRTPEFLRLNPNGKIPLLQLPDGRLLAESNAILYFLSQETGFFPADPYAQALVMQWMFFEQYSHEPFIATSRFILQHPEVNQGREAELAAKVSPGYRALGVMESHLENRNFFVGGFSIADIALFAYTHVAEEGGFALERFPAVQSWIQLVQNQPGFVPLVG